MSDVPSRPSLGAAVYYVDPFAALDWLEKAFGFERQFVVTDSDGQLGHSEMRFGDGYLMVCRAWRTWRALSLWAVRTRSRCTCNCATALTSIVPGHVQPAQ
jgi:uncharacterized glyoxalase superfamily protein PhnB